MLSKTIETATKQNTDIFNHHKCTFHYASLIEQIQCGDGKDHNRIKEHRITRDANTIWDLLVTCGTPENLNINHVTDFINALSLFTARVTNSENDLVSENFFFSYFSLDKDCS